MPDHVDGQLVLSDRKELTRLFEEHGFLGAIPPEVVPAYVETGILVVVGIGVLLWVLTAVFASLDVRELKARQIQRPFSWTFALLGGLIYVAGRSVVVDLRTGKGLGPIWVYLAATAFSALVGAALVREMQVYMLDVAPHIL